MRAYQLPKGGAGIDALVKVERADPKPAYRQVMVKVKACSLNFRDLGIVRGTYRMSVRENLIPLSDGAGEVIEVGPGVTRVNVGDHVAGCFFQRWLGGEASADVHASALGGGIDGMLAEHAVLEEDGVVKIPAHLSLEEGETLPCSQLLQAVQAPAAARDCATFSSLATCSVGWAPFAIHACALSVSISISDGSSCGL